MPGRAGFSRHRTAPLAFARLRREMHELSVAQNILEIAAQHLPSGFAERVQSVRVKVGEMAGIVPESLEFCFGALVEGTPLQGSALFIERVPLRCLCRSCKEPFEPRALAFICPQCGSADTEIVSGRELNVTEIELADEDGDAS